MEQLISISGALLILGAYGAQQMGVLDKRHPAYSWMNLVGSVVLTIIAFRGQQWGFVLLEGAWAVLSVPPLLGRGFGRRES